jgi:predicted acyl esterase
MFYRYKDFAINIYVHAHQISPKIKVVVGPFVHAMPEYSNRNPGPGFDGKAEMVRWFNHWLRDGNKNSDIMNEPKITLFIRTSLTTGTYRYESQWPITRQRTRRMFMSKGQKLVEQPSIMTEEGRNNLDVDTLEYRPWIGFEGGAWLGGLTGDQQSFDKDCLVYDSHFIEENIEIVGFVNVSLQVNEQCVRLNIR